MATSNTTPTPPTTAETEKITLLGQFVKPPTVLKIQEDINIISQYVISAVQKKYPNYKDMKMNISLLEYVCNLVENYFKKKVKIDKGQLVVNILQLLFDITPQEEEIIKSNIQYLLSNGLIKKVGALSRTLMTFKKNFHLKF